MYLLQEKQDKTTFAIYQTTKVRVHKFTKEGIEVITRSQDEKLGFIPYCNLITNSNDLYKEKSLYVHYLGNNDCFLFFAEEGTLVFPDIPQTRIQ